MDERRKDPRFERLLELKVGSPGKEGLKAKSGNISSKGLYCSVAEYIEPFSKLTISLELEKSDGTPHQLACDGVVVRTDPEAPLASVDEYNIAIYFTDLSPEIAGAIDEYLLAEEG
jgi:hypothetical protein